MKTRTLLVLALIAGTTAFVTPVPALAADPPAAAKAKIPVKTADDLPRHSYTIQGKASEFVLSDAPFKAFLDDLKRDLLADLAAYDIQDRTTLQTYHTQLMQIAVLEGRLQDVPAHVEKVRELEGKEAKKLMIGHEILSYVTAKQNDKPGAQPAQVDDPDKLTGGQTGGAVSSGQFASVFKEELRERVAKLPWEKVREEVVATKGRREIASRNLVVGGLKGQLDPVVEQAKGVLSNDLASGLLSARYALDVIIPIAPMTAEVYGGIIQKNAAPRVDLWTPTTIALSDSDKAKPVTIAIWDSGVDMPIFSNQAWTNPNEKVNGKDDDNNGFVDDVHGIAYDLSNKKVPELLVSVDSLNNPKPLVSKFTKGFGDLTAGVDSPERAELSKYIASLSAEQATPFREDLGLFGNYSHGTHVAGIAAEGNPFARIMAVRITFDWKSIPQLTPSVELSTAQAKAYAEIAPYLRSSGVRVVNMSWGGSRKDIEEALELKGVGKDAKERQELAGKLFKIERDALEACIKSCPDILFVAAAGNSDNDNQFAEQIPSGLNLPNMITVGAIDSALKPTGFTTFGKNVTIYANGYEVDSYIPGGQRMKFSGTSMASPNVANLAGKILALNPALKPTQVMQLIRDHADPMTGYEGRFVINPKKTIEAMKSKR